MKIPNQTLKNHLGISAGLASKLFHTEAGTASNAEPALKGMITTAFGLVTVLELPIIVSSTFF